MNLVGIKVTIGLRENGDADHPDFNRLPSVIASGQDWATYVDVHGSGWLYDCCGHKEDEPDSPRGQQFGMLLVPATFAAEAVAAFPSIITRLRVLEVTSFYEDKHAKEFQDEEIKLFIVDAIRAKQDLNQPLTQRQLNALDPANDAPGIRANWRKSFASFKQRTGITVVP